METISAALLAAETRSSWCCPLCIPQGRHPTVERILMPADRQSESDQNPAGRCSERNCQPVSDPLWRSERSSRIAGTELLVATDAILNLIREGKTHQISAMMQAGGNAGMHTLNMDLSRLMRQGYITKERAREYTNNPAELEQYMM